MNRILKPFRALALTGAVALAGTAPLQAQHFLAEVLPGWQSCDFSNTIIPRPHHVMLLGDSNGALYGADGGPGGFINLKSWVPFLKPGPSAGGEWNVLNVAVPGFSSAMLKDSLFRCVDRNHEDNVHLTQEQFDAKVDRFYDGTERIWMQIGGNDMRYEIQALGAHILPHWAHYHINKVLNNIGHIVHLNQTHGRTMILVGYFPLQGAAVARDSWKNGDLVETICGQHNEEDLRLVLNTATQLVCAVGSGLQDLFNPVISTAFDQINKARGWLYDRLGVDWNQVESLYGGSRVTSFFADMDRGLGRAMGMTHSLTGLFEDPAARFRSKNKNPIDNYFSRYSNGIPWLEFWDFIQSTPRGEVGWAVLYALPNETQATSAMISILGRRFIENKNMQGTPVPNTTRNTVEFIDLYPHFKDPNIQWGGRSHLYYEGIHINDEGHALYGRLVAEHMNSWDYDIALGDKQFTEDNAKEWVDLPEDPIQDDINLLILCFLAGICVF